MDSPPNIGLVVNYFYRRLGYHNQLLGFMWIICDLLALLNVIGNFYLTDALLGATFFNYGLNVRLFSKGYDIVLKKNGEKNKLGS